MHNSKKIILISGLSIVVVGVCGFVLGKYATNLFSKTQYSQSYPISRQNRNLSAARRWENQSQRKKRNNANINNRNYNYLLDTEDLLSVGMTTGIRDGLILMREEEKLARDVYLKLADIYDLRVFGNIAKAEQQHMDYVLKLLLKYDISDPVLDDTVGKFTSQKLQGLYNDLLAKGSKNLDDAVQVGIDIEKLDIDDLEMLMGEITEGTDVYTVYQYLLDGSYRHLSAFERQL